MQNWKKSDASHENNTFFVDALSFLDAPYLLEN